MGNGWHSPGNGLCFQELIKVLSNIKYPYNINILTQEKAQELLNHEEDKQRWVAELLNGRTLLEQQLQQFSFVQKVYPSDANYLLVKVDDARGVYNFLVDQKIIIRDRSSVAMCAGCLRITVGTANENDQLLSALKFYRK